MIQIACGEDPSPPTPPNNGGSGGMSGNAGSSGNSSGKGPNSAGALCFRETSFDDICVDYVSKNFPKAYKNCSKEPDNCGSNGDVFCCSELNNRIGWIFKK